ncbi:SDR family NAD(P)-dependent oxidoreductase [Levilactobacillus bambusae]|nr:SDR family oxidoreductase [Levilactobacillus bambusae]
MTKNIVITGGTSGIGLATAKLLANEQTNVIIIGKNSENNRAVQVANPNLHVYTADLGRLNDIKQVFTKIHKTFNTIDSLFINAGFGLFKPFTEITEQDFDRSVDLNYKGAFFTAQSALQYMPNGSNMVFNLSWTHHRGLATSTLYSSTKAATSYLIKSLALELSDRQIRINAVSPGYTNTSQFNEQSIETDRLKQMLSDVPEGRFGSAEEIGNVVKFLMSDEASYVNGQEVIVDGGLTSVQAGV